MQSMPTSLTTQSISISMKDKPIDLNVTIRPLKLDDLEFFYQWASDAEIAKSMTWEAYTSLSAAEKFIREVVLTHPWFYAICFDGKPVRSITLSQGKGNSSCKAELGYVLSRQYAGKGITSAAVKQAIDFGFRNLNIERIEAFVAPENVASQRVLIKSGMKCEGFLKNYIIFKGVVSDRFIYAICKE